MFALDTAPRTNRLGFARPERIGDQALRRRRRRASPLRARAIGVRREANVGHTMAAMGLASLRCGSQPR